MKTAVSIKDPVFEQAEEVAKKMQISRSQLYSLALEDFLRRYQKQELLEKINEAYKEEPDPQEQANRRHRLRLYRQVIEGEW